MRSGELSGLVPRLLSPPWSYFQAFSTLKKFRLSQGFFFFSRFFSTLRHKCAQAECSEQSTHPEWYNSSLCSPPGQPLEAYFRMNPADTHLFFKPTPTSSDPGPVWFTLRHNCESVCLLLLLFFFVVDFFFSFLSTKWRIGFSSAVLAKADRKKRHKSLFYFCWEVEEPHTRLHVVRPEELNSRPEHCRRGTEGNGTERAKGHSVLNHNIMFNFSLKVACEKYAAVGILYAQFTSDWTVWRVKARAATWKPCETFDEGQSCLLYNMLRADLNL